MESCLAKTSFSWNPDLSFFCSGSKEFLDPFTNKTEIISWSFHKIKIKGLPFSVCECRMKGFGYEIQGYGDKGLLKNSLPQAFAEAWERLWMIRLANSGSLSSHHVTSSNGFAAGRTEQDALFASRAELIERAVFYEAWSQMKGWQQYRPQSLLAKSLVMGIQAKGWKVQLFLIQEVSLGYVLTGLLRHPKSGAIFDSIYLGDQIEASRLDIKLLRSLAKCALIGKTNDDPEWQLPERGQPSDHKKYYENPEHLAAFAFLDSPELRPLPIELPDPSNIVSELLVSITDFPAVAISYHPQWPELNWGRSSLRGKNPWIHPLA